MGKTPHNDCDRSGLAGTPNLHSPRSREDKSAPESLSTKGSGSLTVEVISFGYKAGPPPSADMIFDVRFLQNPFWIDELRDQTGLEKPVQDYVLSQVLAQEFSQACNALLDQLLPKLLKAGKTNFSIAFGCTGGQHRSVSIAEFIGNRMHNSCPDYMIKITHREITGATEISEDFSDKSSNNTEV